MYLKTLQQKNWLLHFSAFLNFATAVCRKYRIAMENDNSDEEIKAKAESEEPKPSKPSLIDKIKSKRWTFKVKNNFSDYVTVEPLICFYMVQIIVTSLIEPYLFHKACVSLDEDTHFCYVMTINENSIYQLCATSSLGVNIYCKGLSISTGNTNYTETYIGNIVCEDVLDRYEKEIGRTYVKPEDYKFCTVIEKTIKKYITTVDDSLVEISVLVITFLVVMIVSIWSDKYSKRKICLMLPILGQLITSILHLCGTYSTYLSFDFINTSTKFIESLSGGLSLFLFGCFSYMNNDTIRRKLLFRFGVIAFILTVYRYIPYVYKTVYEYYGDDDSYKDLMYLNLVFNLLCLLYVKIILNESKTDIIVNALDSGSRSSKDDLPASSGNGRKYARLQQVAKAFSLDVIWDYILILFKRRIGCGRLIIFTFLAVVFIDKLSPYGERMTLLINEKHSLDIIDIDGAIFVVISITMILFSVSDVVIAILVIGIPTGARFVGLILASILTIPLESDNSQNDFYSAFKRISACSLLLAFVDRNESRIFLIVQAVAYLPKAFFKITASKHNANIIYVLELWGANDLWYFAIIFVLPLLVFFGLGLLYKFGKRYEQFKMKQLSSKPIEDITENPWSSITPANFEPRNGNDKHQLGAASQLVMENDNSTDL